MLRKIFLICTLTFLPINSLMAVDWGSELGDHSGVDLKVQSIMDPYIDAVKEISPQFETATGATGDNSQTDDHTTMYASYVYGPLTVAYQVSEIDTYTATQPDNESTRWGVLYAVNDEMSISYHDHVSDDDTVATDEEVTGWSASYTVGSMTFKAHRNHGDNLGNAASKESEHTEIGVTFAF